MKKILVADDDFVIREMYATFLEQEKYTVRVAKDGQEALEFLKTWKPDLLITDISMPHVTGRDIVITAKKLYPSLPIIIVSGKDMKADVEIALSPNVKHYIPKPADLNLLSQVISKIFRSSTKSEDKEMLEEQKTVETQKKGSSRIPLETLKKEMESSELAGEYDDDSTPPKRQETQQRIFWDANPQELLGKRLGKVKITDLICLGGMGGIFKGNHLLLQKIVAIKLLYQCLAENKVFIKRFMREAQMAAKLEHPNIVQIYDIGKTEGIYYMVMQYIEGEDLMKRIQRQGRIPYREAVKIIMQAVEGLAKAHEAGLIHRDIKPANLIICQDGRVKIVDFGLSRSHLNSSDLTEAGQVLGTPHYMSPEQASGKDLDPRSDIYSLGITLYHALTGSLPFNGTPHEILLKHLTTYPRPMEEYKISIPPILSKIVNKMIAKDPNDRYQNDIELFNELVAVL